MTKTWHFGKIQTSVVLPRPITMKPIYPLSAMTIEKCCHGQEYHKQSCGLDLIFSNWARYQECLELCGEWPT